MWVNILEKFSPVSKQKSVIFASVLTVSTLVSDIVFAQSVSSNSCFQLNNAEMEEKFVLARQFRQKLQRLEQNPSYRYLLQDISESDNMLKDIYYRLSGGFQYDETTLQSITDLVESYTILIEANKPAEVDFEKIAFSLLGRPAHEHEQVMEEALAQNREVKNLYNVIRWKLWSLQQSYELIAMEIERKKVYCQKYNTWNSYTSSTPDQPEEPQQEYQEVKDVAETREKPVLYRLPIGRNQSLSGQLSKYIDNNQIKRYLRENKALILELNNLRSLNRVEPGKLIVPSLEKYGYRW